MIKTSSQLTDYILKNSKNPGFALKQLEEAIYRLGLSEDKKEVLVAFHCDPTSDDFMLGGEDEEDDKAMYDKKSVNDMYRDLLPIKWDSEIDAGIKKMILNVLRNKLQWHDEPAVESSPVKKRRRSETGEILSEEDINLKDKKSARLSNLSKIANNINSKYFIKNAERVDAFAQAKIDATMFCEQFISQIERLKSTQLKLKKLNRFIEHNGIFLEDSEKENLEFYSSIDLSNLP